MTGLPSEAETEELGRRTEAAQRRVDRLLRRSAREANGDAEDLGSPGTSSASDVDAPKLDVGALPLLVQAADGAEAQDATAAAAAAVTATVSASAAAAAAAVAAADQDSEAGPWLRRYVLYLIFTFSTNPGHRISADVQVMIFYDCYLA
jgi:hypothetical protein